MRDGADESRGSLCEAPRDRRRRRARPRADRLTPESLGAGAPALVVRGLAKRFTATVEALAGVDLDVARGEFVAVVGPSGCGKTTLLRIAAGLETATSGSVEVRLGPPSRERLGAAMVFQDAALLPWLRAGENVALGLDSLALSAAERERRASAALGLVGLGDFARAFPRELSGGMRQRVAIARAFAVDPDVLFMDEPFGALDEQTRLVLGNELARLWERTRKTVLFVTHGIEEAIALADRVVVLRARPGRIADIVAVDLPRPRDLIELRADPRFGALARRIWRLLRSDVEATP